MSILHQIALTFIPGIGSVTARALVNDLGGAEQVFKARRSKLVESQGIGDKTAKSILMHSSFARAEEELRFMERNKVSALFFTDAAYPARLKQCYDAPLLLYYKGVADLNARRIVSIVGTRNATAYGKEISCKLVEELKDRGVLVVSGLAYGIDGIAHRACIRNRVATVAVFGHGLDRIYPSHHLTLADKMLEQGGWLSEYPSQTIPDRENFPKRNRVIAGLADATIVIEAGARGGALITAELANSYNRDVLAYPGNVNSEYSAGCNYLIKTNKAHLVSGIGDIDYLLGWSEQERQLERKVKQLSLLVDLTDEEQRVAEIIRRTGPIAIDELLIAAGMPQSKLVTLLLSFELRGLVSILPGKVYVLNGS